MNHHLDHNGAIDKAINCSPISHTNFDSPFPQGSVVASNDPLFGRILPRLVGAIALLRHCLDDVAFLESSRMMMSSTAKVIDLTNSQEDQVKKEKVSNNDHNRRAQITQQSEKFYASQKNNTPPLCKTCGLTKDYKEDVNNPSNHYYKSCWEGYKSTTLGVRKKKKQRRWCTHFPPTKRAVNLEPLSMGKKTARHYRNSITTHPRHQHQ